ncbi:recombinase family protein [Parvularcula flava]|uniref:Invertase n=1 Tax=Aquisalinus luteolus TaxID=1566827 RepID=A0A8J3A530_9PROT|nr:recombinase family protein [Aquisalinus luteolus]NHK29627.1 recombinase family protein [Aquisalinus luteolus]GGI02290.1 invertase [Aquisalinus luteolus]
MTWLDLDFTGRRLGYARVSLPSQKIDMQINALEQLGCEKIFRDHGVSGAKTKRPGLDAALAELREGDMLIVFKLDRLGRSVLHLADLLAKFGEDGIHLYSASEGINTSSHSGRLVFYLFSVIAEIERDFIIERTTQGIDAARRKGKRIGRKPVVSPALALHAHHRISIRGEKLSEVARFYKVSRSSLSRAMDRLDL